MEELFKHRIGLGPSCPASPAILSGPCPLSHRMEIATYLPPAESQDAQDVKSVVILHLWQLTRQLPKSASPRIPLIMSSCLHVQRSIASERPNTHHKPSHTGVAKAATSYFCDRLENIHAALMLDTIYIWSIPDAILHWQAISKRLW